MQVWREVRFPTVSNSILQTVRKHAAALQTLGKAVENVCVFAPHTDFFFFFFLFRLGTPPRYGHFENELK